MRVQSSGVSQPLTEAAARPAGEKATALTADELATLLAAGLEPREAVPGLFLCQNDGGYPITPTWVPKHDAARREGILGGGAQNPLQKSSSPLSPGKRCGATAQSALGLYRPSVGVPETFGG